MSEWNASVEEKKKYIPYIQEGIEHLKQKKIDDINLDELNPAKVEELLKELGYEQTDFDTNGWEMDFWITFKKPGEPNIIVGGCGYTFTLKLYLEERE